MTNTVISGPLLAQFANLRDVRPGPACLPGAVILRDGSKEIVPVDTGNLRESITAMEVEDGAIVSAIGDLQNERFYAGYVEFGTSKMEAQPYIRPTIDEKGTEIVKAIGAQIVTQLKELAHG